MAIRIAISGWAAISDGDENPVTDPGILRSLDGLVYDDEFFTDYISGTELENALAAALERSGNLVFKYVEGSDLLRVITEFRARRELSPEEIRFLISDTIGQWSDGVGENFVCESPERCGYSVMCLIDSEVDEIDYPFVEIIRE